MSTAGVARRAEWAGWLGDHLRGRTDRVLLGVFLVVPVGIGFAVQAADPTEWGWDDWAALAVAVLTALILFVLGIRLGESATRRAEAHADAELARTVGALARSGARNFAGTSSDVICIPYDATAALQYFDAASADQRVALLRAIQGAYADLIFGTICRADALPRSIWTGMVEGTEGTNGAEPAGGLIGELASHLAHSEDDGLRDEVRTTLQLAHLALGLGRWIRSGRNPASKLAASKLADLLSADTADVDDEALVVLLSRLYGKELLVKHDWELVKRRAKSSDVGLYVSLTDIDAARDWYTPWYVSEEDGRYVPRNVNDEPLDEPAALDALEPRGELPTWPTPLTHDQVPRGMRELSIARAERLLAEQPDCITVCALTYQLIRSSRWSDAESDWHPDERPAMATVVLDGNHRLAGALRVDAVRHPEPSSTDAAQPRSSSPIDAVPAAPVRVLSFEIREREMADDAAEDLGTPRWRWYGFTPDVENLRDHHRQDLTKRAAPLDAG